jgi:hypothetical protein
MRNSFPKSPHLFLVASPVIFVLLACSLTISYTNDEPKIQREESIPVRFVIYANQGWQDTNIRVFSDEMVTVRYISGEWTGGIGKGNWYDGRGDLIAKYKCVENYNPSICDEPMPNVYNGTLVGKIGDSLIEIGNYLQFKSREEGDLFLRMNDHDEGLFDNEGVLTVEIEINN